MPKLQTISNNAFRKVATQADFRRSSGTFYDEIYVITPTEEASRMLTLRHRFLKGKNQLEVYVNGLLKRAVETIDSVDYGDYEETNEFQITFLPNIIFDGDIVRVRITWGAYLPSNLANEILSGATTVGRDVFGTEYNPRDGGIRLIGELDNSTFTPDLSHYRTWKIKEPDAIYKNFIGCECDDIRYLIWDVDGGIVQGEYHLTQMNNSSDWVQVECGYYYTIALKENGTIWAWGNNGSGYLGLGDTISRQTPTQIGLHNDWVKISVAHRSAYGIKTDGSLWAWGWNGYGQLGTGDTTTRTVPTRVGVLSTWTDVSAGISHVIATTSDGKVWAWGDNRYGQVGIGNLLDQYQPCEIPQLAGDVDTIKSGGLFNVVLKNDGTLWSWGANAYGQLGIGNTTNQMSPQEVSVTMNWTSNYSVGLHHVIMIDTDGNLWGWGKNLYGELGIENTVATGTNRLLPVPIDNSTLWRKVFCGADNTYLIQATGDVYGMGKNDHNQLGIYSNDNIFEITKIDDLHEWTDGSAGQNHTTFLNDDRNIFVSGTNLHGEYGVILPHYPIRLSGSSDFMGNAGDTMQLIFDGLYWYEISRSLNEGPSYNNFIDDTPQTGSTGGGTGTPRTGLWSWGLNHSGELGLDDIIYRSSPVQVGTGITWSQVSGGEYNSLVYKSNGTLWSFGANDRGQLGLGHTNEESFPQQIGTDTNWEKIGSGRNFNYAIKSDRSLWSWGDNSYGVLGLGDMINRLTPTQIGSDNDWDFVDGGYTHVIARKVDGSLYAWGNNSHGQLGLNNTVDHHEPAHLGTETDWSIISVGGYHAYAIKDDGTLWSWGANDFGQLGQGDEIDRSGPTKVGTSNNWSKLCSGRDHTVALKTDGTIWTVGRNDHGQLGQDDTSNRNSFTRVGTWSTWVDVYCGYYNTIALRSDGTIWAWGDNGYGQLGLGDTDWRSVPCQVGTNIDWVRLSGGSDHVLAIVS